MKPSDIYQLQKSLGVPITGIVDAVTTAAMNKAVQKAVASNPDVVKYAGNNSADSILNAYTTGNWSGIIDITGKPFTQEQQESAVRAAEKALKPAYEAQRVYDEAGVAEELGAEGAALDTFLETEKEDFGATKDTLDKSAADQGVLFSGSRFQKLNDLRNTYEDRAVMARDIAAKNIGTTAREHQYKYGNEGADRLSQYYQLNETPAYNANVAGGKVTPNRSLKQVYDTGSFKFQGTAPVSQKAAVQTRAAGLLANRANKLTATGYKNQL